MVKKKKSTKKGLFKRPIRKKAKVKPKSKKKAVKAKVKKAAKKTVKRVIRKPSKVKEEKFEVGFEEVVVKCPSCGREFRVVKSSKFSIEGMLCQRCATGGGIAFGGNDEF
jgi:hypothetical protein